MKKSFPLATKTEKRWTALFVILVSFWAMVFIFTIFGRLTGVYGIVDKSVDISFMTIPLLSIIMVYTGVTFLIFIAHLLNIKKAKRYQLKLYESYATNESTCGVLKTLKKEDYFNEKLCTIIIPSKNEESVIRRTVLDCLKQTYPHIEVIVVCHNCTDRTFEQANVGDSRVRVLDLKTKEVGKGIALNYGVAKANGKYLLILDGDGFLSQDFIERAMPLFKDNYAAVQGRYNPSNRNYNLLTKLLSIEGDLWSTPFMTTRSILGKRCPLGGTGYIIRKDALKDVGFFQNHLVDDFELSFRLLRNNYKIAFAPLSIDFDEKPPTLDIMFRQRSRWAKGFLTLLKNRITEPRDILGHLSWLWPIATLASLVMLMIPAYSSIHYMIYEYYPYVYSYLPLNIWAVLTISIYLIQSAVLVAEHGIKGLKYAPYLPLYNVFSQYCFITYLKAFFVTSWANTKTDHGFSKETQQSYTKQEIIEEKSMIKPQQIVQHKKKRSSIFSLFFI